MKADKHDPNLAELLTRKAFSRNDIIMELMREMDKSPPGHGTGTAHYAHVATDFFLTEKIIPLVTKLLPVNEEDRVLLAARLLERIKA